MLDLNASTARPRRQSALEAARIRRAAWAFTTRRVPQDAVSRIIHEANTPRAGDLVLARVESLGYHSGLQLPDGRRRHLFVGDEIVVAYGNRYAPNQFEAVVPKTLGPCHLVASGGVAAKALSWHARIEKGPTKITPLGLLGCAGGEPANLRDFALHSADRLSLSGPTTVAVVGTAMDSGKTQTAAYWVKGLSLAGLKVGYAKITGTGAGGDTWLLKDAGASPVLDFTDAGLVSTYLAPAAEVERVFVTLMVHMAKARVDAVVLELADGLLQSETAVLLESSVFQEAVGGILFAACDSMGAVAGHRWLNAKNLPILAISGVLTSSPLQVRESAQAIGLPVYARSDLAQAVIAMKILAGAEKRDLESTEANLKSS